MLVKAAIEICLWHYNITQKGNLEYFNYIKSYCLQCMCINLDSGQFKQVPKRNRAQSGLHVCWRYCKWVMHWCNALDNGIGMGCVPTRINLRMMNIFLSLQTTPIAICNITSLGIEVVKLKWSSLKARGLILLISHYLCSSYIRTVVNSLLTSHMYFRLWDMYIT